MKDPVVGNPESSLVHRRSPKSINQSTNSKFMACLCRLQSGYFYEPWNYKKYVSNSVSNKKEMHSCWVKKWKPGLASNSMHLLRSKNISLHFAQVSRATKPNCLSTWQWRPSVGLRCSSTWSTGSTSFWERTERRHQACQVPCQEVVVAYKILEIPQVLGPFWDIDFDSGLSCQ